MPRQVAVRRADGESGRAGPPARPLVPHYPELVPEPDDRPSAAQPLRVVAAVIVDDGLVLACRRAADKASAGLWEFPGGKVEPGETSQEAVVREIEEELGVDVTVGQELTTDATRVGERVIELACYHATLDGPRPAQSTDHDRMLWLEPSRLGELEWALPDLPAMRLLTGAATTAPR